MTSANSSSPSLAATSPSLRPSKSSSSSSGWAIPCALTSRYSSLRPWMTPSSSPVRTSNATRPGAPASHLRLVPRATTPGWCHFQHHHQHLLRPHRHHPRHMRRSIKPSPAPFTCHQRRSHSATRMENVSIAMSYSQMGTNSCANSCSPSRCSTPKMRTCLQLTPTTRLYLYTH
jgi:hypothetical protein